MSSAAKRSRGGRKGPVVRDAMEATVDFSLPPDMLNGVLPVLQMDAGGEVAPSGPAPGKAVGQDSVEDSVSGDELPEHAKGSGRRMHAHLDGKAIQKIVQGRFVILASLLPSHRSTNRVAFNASTGALTSQPMDRRLFRFEEWLDAFYIYAAVRAKAHPEEGAGMFKYLQTVKRIKDRNGNFTRYDEAFRAFRADQPSIDWEEVDGEELGWATSDPDFVPYERYKAQRKSAAPSASFRDRPASAPARPRGSCWAFNREGLCGKTACRYQHCCSKCSGKHPVKVCKAE